MSTDITPDSLQIARLEERMATMHRDMAAQQIQLAALQAQLTQVLEALSSAQGGWKMLMLIGGACATGGGALSYIFAHWKP